MSLGQYILQLFRSLFPYWKFFDQFGYVPRLYYRSSQNQQWSEWLAFHELQNFSWAQWLHNPKVNLVHWEQSFFIQAIEEFKNLKPKQIENTESYRELKELIEMRLASEAYELFQFELRGVTFIDNQFHQETWLTSTHHARLEK